MNLVDLNKLLDEKSSDLDLLKLLWDKQGLRRAEIQANIEAGYITKADGILQMEKSFQDDEILLNKMDMAGLDFVELKRRYDEAILTKDNEPPKAEPAEPVEDNEIQNRSSNDDATKIFQTVKFNNICRGLNLKKGFTVERKTKLLILEKMGRKRLPNIKNFKSGHPDYNYVTKLCSEFGYVTKRK